MEASVTKRPGRNEPCHCGSGRKYKHCCLDKDEAAPREARAPEGQQAAEVGPASVAPPRAMAKHQTRQPWRRGGQNTKGFQKLTIPRRSGGS